MIDFLLSRGADPDARDSNGNRPADLLPSGARRPKQRSANGGFDKQAALRAAAGMHKQ